MTVMMNRSIEKYGVLPVTLCPPCPQPSCEYPKSMYILWKVHSKRPVTCRPVTFPEEEYRLISASPCVMVMKLEYSA